MKILCISFKERSRVDRKILIEQIFRIAKSENIDLVILPGNVINEYRIRKDETWASKFADKNDINIIYEKIRTGKDQDNYFTLYSNYGNKATGIQKFAKSSQVNNPKNILYKSLINEIDQGKRSITVDNIIFGIIICGENNILKNIQSTNNIVKWRHHSPKNWNANVILNPSHTTMGNWNKLNNRFKYLSKKYGYSIYLTNSSKKHFGVTSLRIYKNGKEIINGINPDFKSNDKNAIGCIVDIV